MLTVGPVVLSLGNLLILWVLGRNRRVWVWLAVLWQCPSSVYDIVTKQYGWLIMTPFGVYFTIKAYRGIESGEPT